MKIYKYFLLHNKKLKTWIKYWLYHKKAGGSGILSEILHGFSFNLANTLNRKFKLFEIEGNSTQDGSPSPETQVPILSSGDNGSINEKINNKNVINIQPFTVTGGTTSYNGRDFTVNLKAGTYTLQRKYTKSSNAPSSAGMVQLKRNNVFYKNLDAGVASTIVELTEDTDLTLSFYLSTSITSSSSSSIDFYDIQLEQGSTATDYVPHEEQDYSIPVQQPMRSIGDVRDGFAKIDGVWNEVHFIGEKVYNGSENWDKQSASSTENSLFISWGYLPKEAKATACPNSYGVLSNYFKKVTENIWTGAYKGIDVYGNQAFICVSNEIASTVADFKTWLSTHNVEVNYVLKNPTYLPCTQSQIDVLENMPSTYKEMTIINSEDETKAYLNIQYYKEA